MKSRTDPTSSGKKSEEAARKHNRILDGAADMFAEQGYPATDVQALADLLGVGKGTIYRSFPTKRDLFLATVDRGMRLLTEHVNGAASRVEDPLERIKAAVGAYLAFFEANPKYIELVIQERAEFKNRKTPTYFAHQAASIEPWRDLLSSLIASGRIREMPVERVIDVLSDLLYGTIFTNFFARRTKSLESQTQDVLDVVLNGILAIKGRRPK